MRKLLIILLILTAKKVLLAQHLPITSSYMYNGLYINPAYAGSKDALSTDILYRDQWAGFEGSPKTTIFSAHLPLKNEKIALGGLLFNDKIGIENNTGVYGTYAYRLKTKETLLSFGLSGGVDFLTKNWQDITTTQDNDPQFSNRSNSILPNFSFGIYYNTKNYFAGVSVPFFLSRKYANEGLISSSQDLKSTNIVTEGGVNLFVNENFIFKPSTLIKIIPSVTYQVDLNALIEYKETFGFGGSYRTNTAIIGMVYFKLFDNITFSYAHDYTIGEKSQYFKGTNEIYIRYIFRKQLNAQNPRYF